MSFTDLSTKDIFVEIRRFLQIRSRNGYVIQLAQLPCGRLKYMKMKKYSSQIQDEQITPLEDITRG